MHGSRRPYYVGLQNSVYVLTYFFLASSVFPGGVSSAGMVFGFGVMVVFLIQLAYVYFNCSGFSCEVGVLPGVSRFLMEFALGPE